MMGAKSQRWIEEARWRGVPQEGKVDMNIDRINQAISELVDEEPAFGLASVMTVLMMARHLEDHHGFDTDAAFAHVGMEPHQVDHLHKQLADVVADSGGLG